ncbi:hypothetical protein CFT13S00388_09055 [Campylobacter fetus subsp. testudinum]|uniref:DUF4126 domain-containing protein n=1 Tax=Campylobacter fetus TaxID=196 RepID=UPI0008189B72|nr:DUF4126 domain-containing protein [Campylobacter fetus]OCR86453.1 hypothetical protein CFT13S00388_09055 [Campylobacter fetus subsp. testudinum]
MLVGFKPSSNPVTQTKNILFARNIACSKLCELLHMQLIRKNRSLREYYTHPTFGNVFIVTKYNIKSPSTSPYDRNSLEHLGLNQFFMGQSAYKQYQGNISDGIYHDTCDIYPQHYIHFTNNVKIDIDFIKSSFSTTKNGVTVMFYPKKTDNYAILKSCKKIVKTYAHSNNVLEWEHYYIDITWEFEAEVYSGEKKVGNESFSVNELHEYLAREVKDEDMNFKSVSIKNVLGEYYSFNAGDDTYKFSEELKTQSFSSILTPKLTSNPQVVVNNGDKKESLDIVFIEKFRGQNEFFYKDIVYLSDGRIIKHFLELGFQTRSDDSEAKFTQKFLLLESFNVSTYQPIRGNYKFIRDWNFHWRLYVYEDEELWQSLVPPVALFVAVVISMMSFGAATPLLQSFSTTFSTIGAGLSVAGGVSGVKGLSTLGKVFGVLGALGGATALIKAGVNTVSNVASSNASLLNSSQLASANGMHMTNSLYSNPNFVGGFNLSSNGVLSTQSSAGMLSTNLNTGAMSLSTAYGGTSFTSIVVAKELFSTALGAARDLYKAYGDTKSLFKSANNFEDDEMPINEDEKRAVRTGSQSNNTKRRFWDVSDEYDMGLEAGTLFYMKSVKEKIKLFQGGESGL